MNVFACLIWLFICVLICYAIHYLNHIISDFFPQKKVFHFHPVATLWRNMGVGVKVEGDGKIPIRRYKDYSECWCPQDIEHLHVYVMRWTAWIDRLLLIFWNWIPQNVCFCPRSIQGEFKFMLYAMPISLSFSIKWIGLIRVRYIGAEP